jgi:molybdopterin synthase catalytic subunit
MIINLIQNEEINQLHFQKEFNLADCGAICTFLGTTRETEKDSKVTFLEYEAYTPMAIKVMNEISSEAQSLFPSLAGIGMVRQVA